MRLLVGCPVRDRAWIIQPWFGYVEEACGVAGVVPSYVFVVNEKDETLPVIQQVCEQLGRELHVVPIFEGPQRYGEHTWSDPDSIHKMVDLRNILLSEVREQDPDVFLSLDSDILASPNTVANLLGTLEDERGFAAVGGKAYMSRGRSHPSWGMFTRDGRLHRQDAEGVFQVDVIMAVKAMSRQAYAVDYEFNIDGEDIGWSRACKNAGLRLGWNGMEACKHVMTREQLDKVDERCGF